MKMAGGTSKQSSRRSISNAQELANRNAQDANGKDAQVRQSIKTLESKHADSMNNMLIDAGYARNKMSKKIPSNIGFMVDEGQFKLE